MLTGNNRVRSDVYDEALDEKMAPSLGGAILGKEHEMYMDPEKFFQRTLITEQIASILGNVLNVLRGESGKKILVLNALYGGGKTHTLLTVYHALKSPHMLLKATPENEDVKARINRFVEEVSKLGKSDMVIFDGYFSELAPSPISSLDVKAYRVRTLWGYIAHTLGSYSILREYDERQIAPEADKLLKILENRSAIILIDEIAHYIKRFHETPDENLRRYSSAIENFMEALAITIGLVKNAVLIISLPAERREKEEISVEITYQAIRQSIERIFKALGRVYTEYIEPIAPRNIPALLRTRLFDEMDERRARDIHEMLHRTYEENKEIFGAQVTQIGEALRTYPFHPLYISTLIDILDKHEALQKTRDLLRISRKVLREVLREKDKPYDLIMPWHIDLTKDPIRNTLLVGEYESFKPVVEEDINERVKLFVEKPLLARIAAITLLARTFVYGGGLAIIPPKVEALPSEKDLVQMIYEPATFHVEEWAPKDIVDAVRWISGNLLYVVKDEKTGRLWFTKYVTPIKYVEERARKIEDMLAINKVLEYTNKLLRETADLITRKRAARITPKVFDAELSQALKICEPIDVDTRKYVLLACLNVPEREDERKARLEEVLYKTKSGGTRGYANIIYVTFPSMQERIRWALDYAKKLIACDELEKEGIIEKLTGVLGGKEAEVAREVLKRKLEDYKTDVLENLVRNTLGIFDRIAYPHYDETRLANTVKEMDFTVQADSIITAAERSLSSMGIGKLKIEMDYDILDHYLRRVGIDVSDGHEPKTIGAIIDYFYSNPRLPATPKEIIADAIKDGVKRLRIGVRSRGRVYFKRIYETEAPQISEGETVVTLDDGDEILPWRIALQEQMKALKKREFTEGRERKIEEYVIKIDGKEISVEEILSNIEKFDLEQLRVAPIIKVIKTVSIKFELTKSLVEVKPGEPASIEIHVIRIGPYIGEILLKPSAGKIDKEKLKINDAFTKEKITWTIDETPQQSGEYSYTLEATDPQGTTLDVARVLIRVLGEKLGWMKGTPPSGTRIEELEISVEEKFSVKPLDILRRRLSGAAMVSGANFKIVMKIEDGRESSVALNVNNVQIDDVLTLIMAVINRFQLLKAAASLSLSLKPAKGEYFTMPDITEDEKKALEEHKIRYFARVAG
jgi:predicted AAA+ superfamily ATPase